MWLYFFGFFFVFLDFSFALPGGTGSINFMPDFIGYALLFFASLALRHENNSFKRLRFVSAIATALSLAEFFLNLFGVLLHPGIELAFGVLMTVGSLYITYEFSEGAKTIERGAYKKLGAGKISSAWTFICISSLLLFATTFLPYAAIPCYLLHWLAFAWFESSIFHFNRKLSGKEKPE